MTKRHIMCLGRSNILVADFPTAMRFPMPFVWWHIMAMRHGDLPSRRSRTRRVQRHHVAVSSMRVSPDFQSVLLEQNAAGVGDTEHMNVRQADNTGPLEQALRHYRIMVAWQQNDRHACRRK